MGMCESPGLETREVECVRDDVVVNTEECCELQPIQSRLCPEPTCGECNCIL